MKVSRHDETMAGVRSFGCVVFVCRGGCRADHSKAQTTTTAQTTRPEDEKKLAREIYKEFIEIQSGYTTGATTPVADAAAARLRAAGFAEADIFIGGAHPKKANLVVRYRGTGAKKPILLLAHTDVVEAKREDWTMDPFQFVEKDGFFYGRGTGDDKAQAAVWIANLLQYKREGFKPDRDIIVALTADEEGGGGPYNGVAWLLKNRRDLIDAELAVNEGGWGEEAGGRKLSNDVQVSEKFVVNYRLEVRNKGGHSSLPVADNAIYHLAGALDRLSKFAFPLKTNEVTAKYFTEMATIETRPIKADLAKIAGRIAGRDAARGGGVAGLERDAADDVCGDAARGRARRERVAAAGGGDGELPRVAGGFRGVRAQHAPEGDRGRAGELHPHGRAHEGTGVVDAAGCDAGGQPGDGPALARCTRRADHGDGSDGRRVPARAGIPTYGVQGFFHGSGRYPLPWTG